MVGDIDARNPVGSGSTSDFLSTRTAKMIFAFALGIFAFILIPLAIAQFLMGQLRQRASGGVGAGGVNIPVGRVLE